MPPRRDSFRFWQRWLQCVSAGSALVGLVFLLAPGSGLLAGYNRQVVAAFHGEGAPAAALAQQHWAIAVVGSSMLGWGVLLTWVTTVPFGRRERWSWHAVLVSVLAWVAGDSIVSLRAGVSLELLFNTIVVVLIALPLALTWRSFQPAAASADLTGAPRPARGRIAPERR
jgi:hypothetical protein